MNNSKMQSGEILPDGHITITFVRELMVGKPEQQIRDAEDTFREYLMLVKRIAERLETEELGETIYRNPRKVLNDDYLMKVENERIIFIQLKR